MREPNTAFSTSRFMTANYPCSWVYRLFCYFKNWIRLNSELRQRKGVPTLVYEWGPMKETHVNRHPSTENIGWHMSLPPNRRLDGTRLPNSLMLKSHENRRDRSTKDICKWIKATFTSRMFATAYWVRTTTLHKRHTQKRPYHETESQSEAPMG
jgi:hypothetical protein